MDITRTEAETGIGTDVEYARMAVGSDGLAGMSE